MASEEEKQYVCIREKQIGKHESEITELKARANFKDQRIEELSISMRDIDRKLDVIKEDIQQLYIKSVQDDSDIDNRVTALENTVKVLKWVSATALSFLAVVVAILTFSMMHLH